MSERASREVLSFSERQERVKTRRLELEPALASLAIQAKGTYDLLRPHAARASVLSRDHPLRYQNVINEGVNDQQLYGLTATYLMVSFGNNHDLTFYKYLSEKREINWRFLRVKQVDDLLVSQDTAISELAKPRRHEGGVMDIEVSNYKYPKEFGKNPHHDERLSSYFNGYQEAEKYIEEMQTDLTAALDRFHPNDLTLSS